MPQDAMSEKLPQMNPSANRGRSKTLNARSAILIFTAYAILQMLFATVLDAIGGDRLWLLADFLGPVVGIVVMVSLALFLIPNDLKKAGPTSAAWVRGEWNGVLKGLVIGLFMGLGPLLLNAVYHPHGIHNREMSDPVFHMVVTPGIQQLFAIVFFICLAPVSEEMMFRGVLYGGCRKSLGPIWSALIVTAIFVAIHFPYYMDRPLHVLPYIAIAAVLLWCRLHWDAIGPAIAAHGGYNFVVGVIPSLILTLHLGSTPKSVFEQGRKNLGARDWNGAIKCFTRTSEMDPQFGAAYADRAMAERELKDYDKAISDCNRAIEINPNDYFAFVERGLSEAADGNLETAIADYLHAARLNPTNSYAFYELGLADFRGSNFTEAISMLTRAIDLGEHSSWAYISRGNAKFGAGDITGAIADCSQAIELSPTDSVAFYDRGFAKHRNADFEGAIADYDRAIALDPARITAYDDRGLAEISEGKFGSALADFEKAIEMDPTNSLYYNNRGWAEFLKGDFNSSIADATQSLQLDPNSSDAYGTRGWARYGAGDLSGAVEDCKKASQLSEHGSASYFHEQGLLDFIAGNYTKAIADWQDVIRQDPSSKRELMPWIEKAQVKLEH